MEGQSLKYAANDLLSHGQQLHFTFAKRWFEQFKKRYSLCFRRVHGEALSADQDATAGYMLQSRQLMVTYSARDIWNANNSEHFLPTAE